MRAKARKASATPPERKSYRAVLVGPTEVGKTALMNALLGHPDPTNTFPTIGAQYCVLEYPGFDIRLWDTAGQERFATLMPIYLRHADAVILVVDVTTPAYRVEFFEELLGRLYWDTPPVVLHVLNKTDLVSESSLESVLSELDAPSTAQLAYALKQEHPTRRWLRTSALKGDLGNLKECLRTALDRETPKKPEAPEPRAGSSCC